MKNTQTNHGNDWRTKLSWNTPHSCPPTRSNQDRPSRLFLKKTCRATNRPGKWILLAGLLLGLNATGATDLDDMAQAIEDDLDGRTVGYGYAIYRDGVYLAGGGGGLAKLGDPENIFDPGIPFQEDTVKDAHSMSKTITAAAMILAIGENNGVVLDSEIFPYLPADLQSVVGVASPVRDITFRNLLSHRSGMGGSSSYSWAEVKTQLQGGLPNNIGDYTYANWNYAVCRMLIPYVLNEDFWRDMESDLAGTSDNGVGWLNTATANAYINWVRNKVFAPAGINGIHPRPVNDTIDNFAWYYDASDLSIPGEIMPDRRLTVGSGGWAMSAKDYARFISALFRGDIMDASLLQEMKDSELGMFDRTGANGSDQYFNHNGATSSNVGGRSSWMIFPDDTVGVIQVNALNNPYEGPRVDLGRILQESWENSFGSVTSTSLNYPLHIFYSRPEDGWIVSRGIRSNGRLGARNFDFDFDTDTAPVGFEHNVFFPNGNDTFLLRYNPENNAGMGSAAMYRMSGDGSFDANIFTSESWLSGWTHVDVFNTFNGPFLLLHNSASGRIRTLPIGASGNVLAAVSDVDLTAGFDLGEIILLNGQHQFIRYNSSTGEIVSRELNSDGSLGDIVFSDTWISGFTDWEIFELDGNDYIFRYNKETGAARINRINGTLADTTLVLNDTWSTGWSIVRFFEIGSQGYFFRYHDQEGEFRMQEINANGSLGDEVFRSGSALRQTVGTGVFNPSKSSWLDIQVFDATPGISNPSQDLATYPELPNIEIGTTIGPGSVPPILTQAKLSEPLPQLKLVRSELTMNWTSEPDTFYLIQESSDLQTWTFGGVMEGNGSPLRFVPQPDPTTGQHPTSLFYRLIPMESIPPLR